MTLSISKVYIDVMPFLYHLNYEESSPLSQKSKHFFQDIENGCFIGVISSFTSMEYLAAMKGFMSRQFKRDITLFEATGYYDKYEDFILNMGIMVYDSDTLSVDISNSCTLFSDCHLMIAGSGVLRGQTDRKYHTLNGADSLHTLFAIRSNSSHIATFDDDFKTIKYGINILDLKEAY